MDEEREKGESGSSSMDESDNEAVEKELTAEQGKAEAAARREQPVLRLCGEAASEVNRYLQE
jgi:hypothetical protein